MNKIYKLLSIGLAALFISSIGYTQSSEYKYVENFESFPAGWGVYNRNQPGPTNYTWFKSESSYYQAYNGHWSSFLTTGVTTDAKEGDNISQWVFTKPFKVANGDVISFYTKNLYGRDGADRLQVRLAKTSNPYVGSGSNAVGDFDILLEDINADNSVNYPEDWTKYTITIDSLAEGEVVDATFGFRYYVPNVGCIGCPPPAGSLLGLDPEDQYLFDTGLDAGLAIASNMGDAAGDAVDAFTIAWQAANTAYTILDQAFSSGNNGSMVGIDNFVYNPTDIRMESENEEYFTHSNNPTISTVEFSKNICLDDDVQGDNVLDFKIHNNGAAFQITSYSITGANAGDFSFVWAPTTSSPIPANYHGLGFRMKFAPSSSGNKEAIVVFNTNHPSYPQFKFKVTGDVTGDPNPPVIACWNNVNVDLNVNGNAVIGPNLPFYDANNIDVQDLVNLGAGGSLYECDFTNLSFSLPYGGKNYTCADAGIVDTFTVRGLDSRFGSTTECIATVTVRDVTPPVITPSNQAVSSATYYLHPDSAVFYKSQLVPPALTGMSDNCGQVIGKPQWSSNIVGGHGTNYGVTWRFEDQSGNQNFYHYYQSFSVLDTTAPVAICKDVTVGYQADKAIVNALDVNNGSYDASSKNLVFGFWNDASAVPNYGVENDSRLVDRLEFNCSQAGDTHPVTFVVKDNKTQQQSTCTANVTIPPLGEGVCKDATVHLRPLLSSETLYTSQVYQGSGTCNSADITLSKSSFDCSNLGQNTVTVTAVSANNQIHECTANVTVIDFPNYDPEEYATDSVITVYMDDATWPSTYVPIYQPYGLRCNTAYWSF